MCVRGSAEIRHRAGEVPVAPFAGRWVLLPIVMHRRALPRMACWWSSVARGLIAHLTILLCFVRYLIILLAVRRRRCVVCLCLPRSYSVPLTPPRAPRSRRTLRAYLPTYDCLETNLAETWLTAPDEEQLGALVSQPPSSDPSRSRRALHCFCFCCCPTPLCTSHLAPPVVAATSVHLAPSQAFPEHFLFRPDPPRVHPASGLPPPAG